MPAGIKVGDRVQARRPDHQEWEDAIVESYSISQPFAGITMRTVNMILLRPGPIRHYLVLENDQIEKYIRAINP